MGNLTRALKKKRHFDLPFVTFESEYDYGGYLGLIITLAVVIPDKSYFLSAIFFLCSGL
jgi:hypothetical protein